MMAKRGFGMASVRFICGTQDIHKQLENAISEYFHTEDTILYAACFDANGGVFEPLLTDEDAIISDTLNHASIIEAYVSAKPRDTAMQMLTWLILSVVCRRPRHRDSESL